MNDNGRPQAEPIKILDTEECATCDKALAIFGIVLALGFLFISIDLLTGGSISGLVKGGDKE